MMELERPHAAVISTQTAAAASLGDQHFLCLSPAPRHTVSATSLAPVRAASFEHEFGFAVVAADQRSHRKPLVLGHSAHFQAPRTTSAETEAGKTTADGDRRDL